MSNKGVIANKDLAALARDARQQGWRVELTDGGHLRWTPPNGQFYTSSATPSSQRTIANVKAELNKRGLMPMNEYRKLMKQIQGLRNVVASHMDQINEARLRLIKAWEADLYGGSVNDLDPLQILVLDRAINDDGDGLTLRCEECRRHFLWPTTYFYHVLDCQQLKFSTDPTKEAVMPMKRDLTKRPPDREQIKCPECPEFVWVTQPHYMEQHMAAEHGKLPCPYCGKFYAKARGGLGKHVVACPQRPEPPAEQTVQVLAPAERRPTPAKAHKVMPTQHPEWFPAPPMLDGLGDYDQRACTVCKQPVGQGRGVSSVCWNPLCWEILNRYWTERGMDAIEQMEDYVTAPRVFIQKHVLDQERAAEVEAPLIDEGGPLEGEPLVEPTESDKQDDSPPPTAAPLEGPVADGRQPDSTPTPAEPDDDYLWALLEIVLDGPIMLNREALAAVNKWFDTTKALMRLKAGQP